ncbi:MAG: preprotein translocase subunit SecE [Planctomycetaceae bacterium]
MSKTDRESSYLTALTQFGLYKRNQGRLVRQLTAGAALVAVLLAAWAMSIHLLGGAEPAVQYGVPAAFALLGGWAVYRLVNFPKFADFLIDVEGEMTKVSWASADEIKRATAVVLVTMVTLSVVLFLYDFLWLRILRLIGILQF